MKGTRRVFFMTFRNMTVVRLCLVFVLFFCVDRISGKPIFGFLLCELICDDDDVSTTTSSSDDYDWGCDCPPRRRQSTTPAPTPSTTGMSTFGPITFTIPPSNGMNVTMTQSGPNVYMFWSSMTGPARAGVPMPPAIPAPPAPPAPPPPPAPAPGPMPASTAAPPAMTTAAAG